MRPLYTITADIAALDALLEECESELTPEAADAMSAWFKELEQDEGKKLDGYRDYIRHLEMEAAAAKAEAEQWAKRAQSRDSRIKWLKESIKRHLEASGRTKAVTERGNEFRIQKNGGKAPILPEDWQATPIELVPPECLRSVIDVEAVRRMLEAGMHLEFARIGERGSHLRIS